MNREQTNQVSSSDTRILFGHSILFRNITLGSPIKFK